MKVLTCIIVGGGYAGIHAVKSIRKAFREKIGKRTLRLILIDKNSCHLRKVLLFKPAASDEDITIPFTRLLPMDVEFIQATVTQIESNEQRVLYQDTAGYEHSMRYDILILTTGSIVCEPDPAQGGISLKDMDAARKIRKVWSENLKKVIKETLPAERRRLMTIAVAGAGISGIETSAELAHFVRTDAEALGLDPNDVRIYLLNAHQRLFQEGPDKVGLKLEQLLTNYGITIVHGKKVLQETAGKLYLSNGEIMNVGLCIWTLGLLPNPILKNSGLPLTSKGDIVVDEGYRVYGNTGIYSIGDCARIIEPNGRIDGKTCKEAIAQARRLGKIVLADIEGGSAPSHKKVIDFFCFGLGPKQGLVWVRYRALDIILTGKLGWWIRKKIWNLASMLK
ncbi:NAD(P)/FAD-dependent oxidoreductase [Oceanobacillus jeddahense]|uniref:NAD(P)/FAD-dependent oxidoreductase n=1 Tax=Oceanobacillus jeddahense TaxID=1462527 RepID=UPI003631499D